VKVPAGGERLEYIAITLRPDCPLSDLRPWVERAKLLVRKNGIVASETNLYQCRMDPPMSGRFVLDLNIAVKEGDEITACVDAAGCGDLAPEGGVFLESELSIIGAIKVDWPVVDQSSPRRNPSSARDAREVNQVSNSKRGAEMTA